MYVKLSPDTCLEFEFVEQMTCISVLKITNIFSERVAFKVKTTAPKSYIVKPNSGVLVPGESKDVTITLQPLPEYPGEVNHKFLVKTVPTELNSVQIDEIARLWADTSSDRLAKAIDVKLPVRIVDSNNFKTSSSFHSFVSEPKSSRVGSTRIEVQDLKDFQDKQENTKAKLEEELSQIVQEIKRKDDETTLIELEGIKGFGVVHLVLVCIIGIIFGYIYAILKS